MATRAESAMIAALGVGDDGVAGDAESGVGDVGQEAR
jgi:hypothetical protein